MEILVTAATRAEIAAFSATEPGIDILITGVGAPACMYSLGKQLQRKHYDLVIQAGIAGTFKTAFSPGESVIVKQEVFADLGIYENDEMFTLFDKGFADPDKAPYEKGWLVNSDSENYGLTLVKAVTVNTVSDKLQQAELLVRKFDADIESMEGAAFHYVCISESVKFIQLRSISNFVGERVKTNWKMKESIQSLNENLVRIIGEVKGL